MNVGRETETVEFKRRTSDLLSVSRNRGYHRIAFDMAYRVKRRQSKERDAFPCRLLGFSLAGGDGRNIITTRSEFLHWKS